jgi:hypothetical protein
LILQVAPGASDVTQLSVSLKPGLVAGANVRLVTFTATVADVFVITMVWGALDVLANCFGKNSGSALEAVSN